MRRSVQQFNAAEELHRHAAATIVALLGKAIDERGSATLVLSGGSTPKAVYGLLGREPLCTQIRWDVLHVFWGDERLVPPTHPESNYRMAREAFLATVPVPGTNIHRIESELPPEVAADRYERVLKDFFPARGTDAPRFDVLLLGMGNDGHTASLFPGTAALDEHHRWVADVFVPQLNTHRVTLTFPAINRARTVLILVSGKEKAATLAEVLGDAARRYPVQHVRPVDGELLWLVDGDAATLLQRQQHSLKS